MSHRGSVHKPLHVTDPVPSELAGEPDTDLVRHSPEDGDSPGVPQGRRIRGACLPPTIAVRRGNGDV